MEKLTPTEHDAKGKSPDSSYLTQDVFNPSQDSGSSEVENPLSRLSPEDASGSMNVDEGTSLGITEQDKPCGGPAEYEFFREDDERREMVEICSRVVDYMHDNEINNLVLVDRSARPAHIGIRETWRRKYKDKRVPNIYFINPTGFVGQGVLGWMTRSRGKIQQDFESTYARLSADKHQPLLLFDNCIHSGKTIKPVIEMFKQMGHTDVRIGVAEKLVEESEVKPDFVAFDDIMLRCYAFGKDRIVEKGSDSVTSSPAIGIEERDSSIRLRKEILQIFREAPDEWFSGESN